MLAWVRQKADGSLEGSRRTRIESKSSSSPRACPDRPNANFIKRARAGAMADKDKKPAAAGKPEADATEESQPQSSSAPTVIEAIVHPLVLLSVTGTCATRAAVEVVQIHIRHERAAFLQTTTTVWPKTRDGVLSEFSWASRRKDEVCRARSHGGSLAHKAHEHGLLRSRRDELFRCALRGGPSGPARVLPRPRLPRAVRRGRERGSGAGSHARSVPPQHVRDAQEDRCEGAHRRLLLDGPQDPARRHGHRQVGRHSQQRAAGEGRSDAPLLLRCPHPPPAGSSARAATAAHPCCASSTCAPTRRASRRRPT